MPDDDFNLENLAAYLHLTPAQVSRLAERDNLPGRRVGGEWRFSPAEIHHWLERKIGLSDAGELVRMEGVLDRASAAAGDDDAEVSIGGLLPLHAIAVPLAARTRNSVIESMAELAAATGWLWDQAKLVDAVRAREEMHPTALESGVAFLHSRRPMTSILGQAFLAFGRTDGGIPFGGSRGMLTDLFFLICSLEDRGHLRVLARLSRLVGSTEFLAALRAAPDAIAARELIEQREIELAR